LRKIKSKRIYTLKVKYGVFLPSFGRYGDPELIIDTAIELEDAGWDGIFLPDHLFHDQVNGFLDPLLLLQPLPQGLKKSN
jgi:alkanesulfonate monooxygenase SsuD/methylene tetrahydromethanopterin reductase-like flavin-dependent oxidoreductase (luciferase family)